jgi:membrane-associated protease RseP (regulator of RpoE activity)
VLYALGVIIFAVGLLVSIALHEIGHLTPAKLFGVKVTQYMVGFGPTLWSRKKGETEYGVKWIPLGGYIRMIGMVPPLADGTVSRWPRRMATAIEDFRQVSRSEVKPEDADREFYRLTPGKKMIIMLGGPTMNLIIYLVIMVVLLMAVGLPHDDATTRLATVSKCVAPATAKVQDPATCTTEAPAALAGLKPGDRILSVDGTAIKTWDQLVTLIEPSAGKTLHVTYERDGRQHTTTLTPVKNTKWADDAMTKTKVAGFAGISPTDHHYYVPVGITAVPGQIGNQIGKALSAVGDYPHKIASLWQTVFDNKPRDPQGAIGVVGIGRLGGEIAETNQFDLQDKIVTLLSLLASVNLLLFFFNLLPLLPLDGGHVAGAIVEATRRGWARLRGRRRQIFVDTAQLLPVMYVVGSVLIVLTLLTLYADIVKPVQLFGG